MRESLSLAFLALLEQLQPAERAVFLLREVFDYDYAEIARFTGKKEAACWQMFSRAKKRLAGGDVKQQPVSTEEHQRLMTGFIQAVREGDTANLVNILAKDVTLVADGGGKVAGAATRVVAGREAVAQFAVGASRRFLPPTYSRELTEVNNQPAIIERSEGRAIVVLTVEVERGQIKMVRIIANPDKLSHL